MKIFETLFDIITLPVDILKDIVTLGGIAAEEEKSFTRQKMEKLDEDLDL